MILLSVFILAAYPLAAFVNCGYTLGHSHDHAHTGDDRGHVHSPPVQSLVEIHCLKLPRMPGPVSRPGGVAQLERPAPQMLFEGLSSPSASAARIADHDSNLPFYTSLPPNLISRGTSYRLFLSVLQI